MRISYNAAIKLKIAAHNYLDECYIKCNVPHADADEFYDFISNRIKQIKNICEFLKEPIEVDVPLRYLGAINEIIGCAT